jgi:hypothetical protein
MSDLTKKKQLRSGHRAYATRTLAQVKKSMDNIVPEIDVELVQLKLTLKQYVIVIGSRSSDLCFSPALNKSFFNLYLVIWFVYSWYFGVGEI